MLFDLKGRRKRFIQVVYLVLAIMFGGGLVLFGVGSDVQGGLIDAFTGGGSNTDTSAFEERVERAERAVQADPKNERAWRELARARYNLAIGGDDYNREVGQFEEGAVDDLDKAAQAWERYLELDPERPDPSVAALMVQAYGALVTYNAGSPLELFEQAARTQRVIAEQRPSPIAWYQLAIIYYAIGEIEKGDRARVDAIELTPSDQRNTVRAQLEDARKDGLKAQREVRRAEEQARRAAQEARKSGQDPFGAAPGQTPLGAQSP